MTAHGEFTGDIKSVLYVSDVEVSARFYRDVLGFELLDFAELQGQRYYCEMAAGGRKFGLHEPTAPDQRPQIGQQRLYFRVRDLLAHRTRILAWQNSPGEIKGTDWMDMFVVRDPDGHQIVFATTDPAQHGIDPW